MTYIIQLPGHYKLFLICVTVIFTNAKPLFDRQSLWVDVQYLPFLFQDKYPVRTNFLEGHEITGKMRSILIDWLCQVHHRFHGLPEVVKGIS
jgi:hypothetical protein